MTKNYFWTSSQEKEIPFDPMLRKATPLMRNIYYGLVPLMESQSLQNSQVQTFFASRHGELESTFEFLKGVSQRELARPFLFQNSLHHSTNGFTSQKFKLMGPTYSICAVNDPSLEVLFAGLMQNQITPEATLFMMGESFPDEIRDHTPHSCENNFEVLFMDRNSVNKISISREVKVDLEVSSFSQFYEIIEAQKQITFKIKNFNMNFLFAGTH